MKPVRTPKWFARLLIICLVSCLVCFQPAAPAQMAANACGYNPITAAMLADTSQDRWSSWIESLSGAVPVVINGATATIQTRDSFRMFPSPASPNAAAFEYIQQQVLEWGYSSTVSSIEADPYTGYETASWYNLILTVPGATLPTEEIILSAHLDSTSYDSARAPGAEDNGSGSAALLEAARLLRYYQFTRTVRIIWFTGEEQGLLGSTAYVEDHPTDTVKAVINLDMYGYDSNNDRCFELHVGTLPAAQELGQCMGDAIAAYGLNLPYDFYTISMPQSDHQPFLNKGIPAIEVLENHFNNSFPNGCVGSDPNPYYHQPGDTIDKMNLPVGFDITQAALAAWAAQAGPVGSYFNTRPQPAASATVTGVDLTWAAVPGAAAYRIYRSSYGCSWQGNLLGETSTLAYHDSNVPLDNAYSYQVEAVAANGFASSPPGCIRTYSHFFPYAAR